MHDTSAVERPALGIIGATPTYARGLAVGLSEHGWQVEPVHDGAQWLHQPGQRILLAQSDRPDPDDPLLALDRTGSAYVVVLTSDPVAEDYVALTRAGADGIAPVEAEADHLAAILEALIGGHALLPVTTLYRLTAIARSQTDHPVLADSEIKWLTLLAQGRTITELAALHHRSPRAMHRALAGLYQRIDVHNRDQAVAWAARHGHLDDT